MIDVFIKRPAMTFIFILIFMVMGLVSIGKLIIEPTPKIDFPIVTVQTVYAGASPNEIETQILKKIEDAIAEVSQIKSIKSDARESVGVTVIEFLIEADVNIKSIEIKDKVEAILNDFPSGADRPIIAKFDPLLKPISTLVLKSDKHDPTQLFEYADKILKSRLSSIDGVASVDVFGGRERQINVELDNNLLIQNYLSIQDVISSIARKNLNVPGGSIDRSDSKINVRFVGEFEDVESIGNLEIVSREGKILKLKNIGTVTDGYKKIEKMAIYNGEEVVGLDVKKLSDGDAVKIVGTLKSSLEKIRATLPEGMTLELALDTTQVTLDDTINTLRSIGLGVILTILILLTFLGDWRGAIIAAVVIPTSIISTFFLMDLSNFTINMMTLLAFGTCLGTLIANALIIIENVNKHLLLGKDSISAAVDGTKEVLLSVFASSGTNLVVFTPLAFMGGIVGKFMLQFGMTVVYTTLFSILASVTLTPTLCALLLKDPRTLKGPFMKLSGFVDKILAAVIKEYKRFFNMMMKFPITTIIIMTAIFLTVLYPIKRLGGEFVPKSDKDLFNISVLMPDGTPVARTAEIALMIEKKAREYPEVKSVLTNVGYDGEETARLSVNLVSKSLRNRDYKVIMDDLLPKIAMIPEAEITLSGGSSTASNYGDITIDIKGSDFKDMEDTAKKMKSIMEKTGYFSSIESSFKEPKMEVRFTPDPKSMIKQNLTNTDAGTVIRALVNGNDDATYKEKGEEYDINVTLAPEFKQSIEDFDNFLILGKDGLLPISSVGKIEYTKATSPLKRRDKNRIIQLNGYLVKGTPSVVTAQLDDLFAKAEIPNTVQFTYTGNAENQNESNKELGKAFVLAVILTYMLLVAVLDSFIFPVSIGSSILTSFLGVFLMLYFFELSINIGSMMAIVMVVGLAVNNAILMIEYAQQKLDEGIEIAEALWIGASEKVKPILMTSIAIIAGTAPQLYDPDQIKSSMGAVVIGGMIGSMFFTFFMVPSVHLVTYRFKRFFKRVLAGKEPDYQLDKSFSE